MTTTIDPLLEEVMSANVTDVYSPDPLIKEIEQLCWQQLNSTRDTVVAEQSGSALFCTGTFDGWACWPDTPAGRTAFTPCPEFITGFDPTRMAHKDCDANGSWFRHPHSGQVWSNYTTCINLDDLNLRQQVIKIYEIGYMISLVALLVSLGILSYFKSLRCSRITLHMNLFASFAINNALWVLWYGIVVQDPDVTLHNGIWCRILHVVLHYFLLTNYAWMLCEGFYLHTLLVSAFVSESQLLKWLYVLGWAMPGVAIVVYAALRGSDVGTDTIQCWMNESRWNIVLVVPVCASVVLNLVFLCNIIRVILIKLRAGPRVVGTARPSGALLQAFRATLLLVPLLGLHYLLTPFRPPKDHPWENVYEVTSAITASFQGLAVATLFCFCNGEVIAQVKRRWQHLMFLRPRANSCTATTVSVRQFVRSTNGPTTGEDNV